MILETAGLQNSKLLENTNRIFEGGSWKKQRVIMIIPAAKTIAAKVYLSHCSLIFPPNQNVYRMLALGMEVGEAYSQTIEAILGHPELSQWEYILTVEHDNIPPADGVIKLIAAMDQHTEYNCIGGLYWTKGENGCPQIWGDIKDPILNFRPQPPIPGEIVECCGVGMGFNLWRLEMFKDTRLRKPWFKTIAETTGVGTQDLYFWSDARKYGYRCAVDCSTLVGHYDFERDLIW